MIKPVLKEEALVKNVETSLRDSDRLHLWWLGQSGFLVQWNGEHLLFDPYLSDSLTEKYKDTDRPHVRMTELVVDPARLDFIDVVTSSHNHTDHLDPDTLKPLIRRNRNLALVIPEANREFVCRRLGCGEDYPIGLDDDLSVDVGEFTITGIAAAHEQFDTDEEGRHRNLGYIVQVGPWTLFHAGDGVVYDGLAERLQSYAVDLALLPINGQDPARGVAGNMSGAEAAKLAREIDARLAIPCHYEMFEFNTVSSEGFRRECTRLDQPYRILKCGEHWSDRELTDLAAEEDSAGDWAGGRGRARGGAEERDDY